MYNFYAARPINTYGAAVGEEYLSFLSSIFQANIVDPNGPDVHRAVDGIKAKYPSRADYDQFGAREVMDYFAKLVLSMKGGAGLALPVRKDGQVVYAIPAGIARELATIQSNGCLVWIVTAAKHEPGNPSAPPFSFAPHFVTAVSEREVPSSEKGGKETLRTFVTETGPFYQLTIQETRERIYCWPNRERMRPYFLEDTIENQ